MAKIVPCPICGRKIATVSITCSKNTVCPGCKVRIQIDYDKKTDTLTTGRY